MSAILSASGKWRIDKNGELVVIKVKAEEVETGKLKVGAQAKPEGITLYDPDGSPYCIKIKRGGTTVSVSGECGANVVLPPESSSPTP